MYYISEGWDLAKFRKHKTNSNSTAEDLEIITRAMREDFKTAPRGERGLRHRDITIVERNRKGELKTIKLPGRCRRLRVRAPFMSRRKGAINRLRCEIHPRHRNWEVCVEPALGGNMDVWGREELTSFIPTVLVHLTGQTGLRSTRSVHSSASTEGASCPWCASRTATRVLPHLRVRVASRRDQDCTFPSDAAPRPTAQYLGVTPSDS